MVFLVCFRSQNKWCEGGDSADMSHNFTSCEYMGLELDAAKFQTEEKKKKKNSVSWVLFLIECPRDISWDV